MCVCIESIMHVLVSECVCVGTQTTVLMVVRYAEGLCVCCCQVAQLIMQVLQGTRM